MALADLAPMRLRTRRMTQVFSVLLAMSTQSSQYLVMLTPRLFNRMSLTLICWNSNAD